MRLFRAFILLLATVLVVVVTLSYVKSHGQPYSQEIDEALVPTYTPVKLDFARKYDGENSLPMAGSAIIDVDSDGVPELFLGGGRDQSDALFRYTQTGFEAIPEAAGISKNRPDASYGAATVDVDHDGDSDLFVARDSGVTLYLNDGGQFEGMPLDLPFDEKSTPLSFAFADLNRDGAVDLFVSAYLPKDRMEGLNIFNQEGYGANSLLLLNNGDGSFTDITDRAGLRYTHNTFQGVFIDLDGDKELDLVVAHDTGSVKTWKNLGNLRFRDMPNPTSDVFGYPMGIAVADYDQDGRPDFFFSNTGGTAPRFLATGDLRDDQVFEDRLIFFKNEGDFEFTNINEETKTADYEFSWGTVFHDLNLDGRQDLIISQNYIDFPLHRIFRLPGRVLIQRPDGTFAATEDRSRVVNRNYEITSLVADFNQDGYPDMVRVNLVGPSLAFIHEGGPNHYLKVRLPDVASSMGARVAVTTASGKRMYDWHVAGEGLVSDQTHVLTFGLGQEEGVRNVAVEFMDGRVESIDHPPIDRVLDVSSSAPRLGFMEAAPSASASIAPAR